MNKTEFRKTRVAGEAVATDASKWRRSLREQTSPGDDARERRIAEVIEKIDAAMRPIRSAVAWALWHPELASEDEARMRSVSRRLQYERKQLKKMRRPQ